MGVERLMHCRGVGPNEVTVNVKPGKEGIIDNRVRCLIGKPVSDRVVLTRDIFPTDFLV